LRNKIIILFLIGFCILFISVSIKSSELGIKEYEQDNSINKFGFGLKTGLLMFSNKKYSNSFNYGVNLSFNFNEKFCGELSILNSSSDVENDPEGLSSGNMNVIPLHLSIKYRFLEDKILPYILAGAGYYIFNFETDCDWENYGFNIEEKIENKIGYHIGAGIDYNINRKAGVNIDFRYCMIKTTSEWRMIDTASSEEVSGKVTGLDMNSFMINLGFNYYF